MSSRGDMLMSSSNPSEAVSTRALGFCDCVIYMLVPRLHSYFYGARGCRGVERERRTFPVAIIYFYVFAE